MGDKLAHSAETVRERSKQPDYWGGKQSDSSGVN